MKKLYKILSRTTNIICQLILIFGCIWLLKGNSLFPSLPRPYESVMMESAPAAAPMSGGGARSMMKSNSGLISDAQASEVKPRAKIIKTGSISFEVEDIVAAKKRVVELLPSFKAYILNENEGKDSENQRTSISIKVPADQFDALLEKIVQTGFTVENKSIQLSDITEQYIDLEARLKNKRILKEKYTSLLTNAQKMADIIEINRQLEFVSSELESLEGQMKYLNYQVDLSTLDVSFVKRLVPTEKNKNFFSDLKYELNAGLNAFRSAILFVLGLWPFITLLAVGFVIYRRFRKK